MSPDHLDSQEFQDSEESQVLVEDLVHRVNLVKEDKLDSLAAQEGQGAMEVLEALELLDTQVLWVAEVARDQTGAHPVPLDQRVSLGDLLPLVDILDREAHLVQMA